MTSTNIDRMGCILNRCTKHIQHAYSKVYDEVEEEPSYTKLKLDLQLRKITYGRTGDNYTVFLFGSRDAQDNAEYNRSVRIKIDEPTRTDFALDPRKYTPDFIHVWLFVTSKDLDGVISESLLGCGSVSIHTLLNSFQVEPLSLLDFNGKQQAVLQVKCTNGQKVLDKVSIDHSSVYSKSWIHTKEHPLSKKYKDRCDRMYNETSFLHEQKFVYVDTHVGRLPIISSVIAAAWVTVPPARTVKLLNHLLQIASCVMGAHLENLEHEPENTALELMTEMLSIIIRCMIYKDDTTRAGVDRDTPVDQWVSLNCFPNWDLAAFDCEDPTVNVLQIFNILKYVTIPQTEENGPLLHIQRLAKAYTPFMCFGQIVYNGEKVGHAFVVLKDSAGVRREIGEEKNKNELKPTLTVDGANYCSSLIGVESQQQESQEVESYRKMGKNISTVKRDVWNKILKYKMPASVVRQDVVYGPVSALVTSDYTDSDGQRKALHILTGNTNDGEFTVGLKSQELFSNKTNHTNFKVILELSETEVEDLQFSLLSEFPPIQIPFAPEQEINMKFLPKQCYFVRQIDTETFDMKQALRSKFSKRDFHVCTINGKRLFLCALCPA